MAVTNKVLPITMTNIASSAVTGSYQAINSTGFPFACFLIDITNASTTDVTISFDGTNDHEYVIHGTNKILNFQTNSQPNNNISKMAIGTVVYVKGTAGTGNIYVSGFYQPQQN